MATVPVFTHWAYFAVCSFANFFAKAEACLPGNGWPPQLEPFSTSSSARASSLVAIGHLVKGVLRNGLPPVIASFPTCASLRVEINSLLMQYLDWESEHLGPRHPNRGRRR